MKQNKQGKSGSTNQALVTTRGNQNTLTNKIARVFNTLMKNNEEETIELDEMCDRLPGVDRMEVQTFMEKQPGGDFIAGRRGHSSRFVYGAALAKWKHQEEIRREWRIRNNMDPKTGTPLNNKATVVRRTPRTVTPPAKTVKPTAPTTDEITQELNLKVTIGDQEVSIPLKMELEKVS